MFRIRDIVHEGVLACGVAFVTCSSIQVASANNDTIIHASSQPHTALAPALYTIIHSFQDYAADGDYPIGNLVADKVGNVYGVTQFGGNSNACGEVLGCGTAYKLAPDGTETLLHSFCSRMAHCSDGALPQAGLTLDRNGNPYGTTFGADQAPGKSCPKGCGNLYSLQGGGENTVVRFNGKNGEEPAAPLLRRGDRFYGTTYGGGRFGGGTLFEIKRTGKRIPLHFFGKGDDGYYPYGPLGADSSNNLYGTTVEGGKHRSGVVFEFAQDGSYKILYAFCAEANCADGTYPYGGVIIDKTGSLYGTTQYGGANCSQPDGCGTVFKLAPDGTETVLHAFAGGNDGAFPFASLLMDKNGNLDGTTENGGGDDNGCIDGCGTIFGVAADGTETLLHVFNRNNGDGVNPFGGLIEIKRYLYGTASLGGSGGDGIVFKLKKQSR